MKRLWAIIPCLAILFAGLMPQPTYAQDVGWLTGYTYRIALWVTGSQDGAQTNYQIPINIYPLSDAPSANNTISLNSHNATALCKDIRFTTDDGTTGLSFWTEDDDIITDPIVTWVEFDSIPAHPRSQMFYMYYGNAGAADASSGANTFIVFDDFEGGVDGGTLNAQPLPTGGTWTVTSGTVEYDDDDTIAPYGGLLMAKEVGAVANPVVSTPATASDDIAVRFRLYKEAATQVQAAQGDGGGFWHTSADAATNDIRYYSGGGWTDTGHNLDADAWTMFEFRDFDWAGDAYDIIHWPAGVETVAGNDVAMQVLGGPTNLVQLFGSAASAGNEWWFDNLIVRNYTENEPWVEAWGNEHCNVGIETDYLTGRDTVDGEWAILNGIIVSVHSPTANCTERGFDYGLSEAMLQSWTETGLWTTGTRYSRVFTGLAGPGSNYYYRAKTSNGTCWSYGQQKRFSLSPQQYEWYDTGDDSWMSYNATGASWLAQTFTVSDIAFSASAVDLKLGRFGATPGTVTVSLREAGGGEPSRTDLVSGTLDGDDFVEAATTSTWYTFDFTSEVSLEYDKTYAIVVRAIAGDATNYIRWRCDAGGGLPNGNALYSTDSANSWTQNITADCMFRVWGNPVLEVSDAKVFETYIDENDWLFCCRYLDEYPPGYNGQDVSALWNHQLVSADGLTVLAQNSVADWGFKPGSIYLSPTMAGPLEWEMAYRMRIQGNMAGTPFAEYPLFATDWWGSDLTRLDTWVRTTAVQMEDYYGVDFTTYIRGKGLVLNSDGGSLFVTGIPALDTIRPDVFATVVEEWAEGDADYTQQYQRELQWEASWGPYMTEAFTSMGNVFGLSGSTIGAVLGFLLYALIVMLAFDPGHAIAAIILPVPILLIVWGTGLAELVFLGVIMAVCGVLLIKQFWFTGA